jgi:Amt family ammonium transporter
MKIKKIAFLSLLFAVPAFAWAGDEAAPTVLTNAEAVAGVQTNLDYVWTLVAAALVFFMQAGWYFLCRPVLPWWRQDSPGLKVR